MADSRANKEDPWHLQRAIVYVQSRKVLALTAARGARALCETMAGTLVDSSSLVSRGAPARQPFNSSDSDARSKRCRAAKATLPSNPVQSTGG